MKNNTISKASKENLHRALQDYEAVKLEIERQRLNELRLESERREREWRERELRNEKINQSIKSILWSWPFLMFVTGICAYLKTGDRHSDDLAGEIFANTAAAGVVGAVGAAILFFLGGIAFAETDDKFGKVFGVCFKIALIALSLIFIFCM